MHFFVYWTRPGWGRAFCADVCADSARQAKASFAAMFPADRIVGVKLAAGYGSSNPSRKGGRWLA